VRCATWPVTWSGGVCVWSRRDARIAHTRRKPSCVAGFDESDAARREARYTLMAREQRIVETFVEFADTLVADFDVVEFLHRVAERCVELLDCVEAGLLIADPAGALRVMASSSERTDALELLQAQNAEGPCFECYQHGAVVLSEDLSADAGRWPLFAPEAVRAGFASVHAVPMRAHGKAIGALNLFRSNPGRLAQPDVPVSQGMADVAAIGLLNERQSRETHDTVSQLQRALQSRVVIEQAKGLLAERLDLSMDEAFARLRGYARAHSHRLSEVADELIDGRLNDDALIEKTAGRRMSDR
jgi:GAF domain-containing protein